MLIEIYYGEDTPDDIPLDEISAYLNVGPYMADAISKFYYDNIEDYLNECRGYAESVSDPMGCNGVSWRMFA
jgi:hypothetical protein